MKAKIFRSFLLLLIVLLLPLTLAGCGNKATVQGTLNSLIPWGVSEEFTYDIYDEESPEFKKEKKEAVGTYKVTLKKHPANEEFNLLKKNTENKVSYSYETIEIIQKLQKGTTTITHQSVIRIAGGDTLHSPIFASKTVTKDTKITYFAFSDFTKKKITGVVNGKNVKIDRKKIMFDNAQLHQLIRSTSELKNLVFNFVMSTFENNTITSNSITVENKKERKGKEVFYNTNWHEYKAYELEIRKNTKLISNPQKIYLCEALKYKNWEIKNPVVRFEEYKGKTDKKIIYELKDYKLI